MAASVAQESPPFPAPEDQEQKNIIDKLAKFVARNGSKFEEMTKEKQKDNQKFSFLFSGEHYNYYKWRVSVEIAQNQTQQHKQNVQQYQQKQVIPGQVPQYGANPQAAIIQQAIVQQSINSAPWQQAQQQAQQQMQTLQQQQQQQQSPGTYTYARSLAPAQPPDLNLTDFESLLQKIMESCTKDSISVGKNWIINNNKSPQHCYHITQYLLRRALTPGMQFQHKLHIIYLINDLVHHCARKQSHDLQKAIQDVVVPIFVHTHLEEPPENQQKLTKVLNIWESNNLLEGSYIMQMKAPESSQATVQAALQQHGFAPQYNYQQPVSVSGSEPLQFNPYQQYQQYYQQYPVYQQPPPQYQQADVQAAPQYQQPQADAPPPPHSQFQQPSTDMQPQQVKQEEEEQVENTKNSLEENIEKPGDSEEGDDTQAVSGKGDDSQTQKEEMHDRDVNMMGAREAMQHDLYQAKPYQEYHYEEHPPYHGPPPPFQDYPHFPPPFPPPDFTRPPPSYNQIPPGYPEGGYGYHGPPPPFAHPGGPPEEFDYHHPRPVFGEHGPPMLNEYNHGMGNEGYEEEFEEPPPPEPIIPNAMYYELPAGLMAPLVKISDVDYKPIDPADLRLPAPQPPSERLLAAVEAFYSPPSHERPRNSEGWEQSGLFEFYKAKLPFIKERDARAKRDPPQEITQTTSRSRSRSISPVRSPPARSRSRSRSPKRRRSRSPSPPPRRRRSRSRSFSPPRRRRSRSRSRSRSLSPLYPRSSTQRSPSPPPFMPAFETKTLDTRIEESNVGHMLLKKMGWEGAGLGKTEQGIQNPISAGEVRDKFSKYKGVGVSLRGDAFEEYRKNRSYTYNRPRSSRTRGDED